LVLVTLFDTPCQGGNSLPLVSGRLKGGYYFEWMHAFLRINALMGELSDFQQIEPFRLMD
jgi:hypothetical protein